MMTRGDAMRFVEDMKNKVEVNVVAGINVFLTPPSPLYDKEGEGFRIIIDPSALSEVDEDKVTHYATLKGFTAEEVWTDLGRYIKVWKRKGMNMQRA